MISLIKNFVENAKKENISEKDLELANKIINEYEHVILSYGSQVTTVLVEHDDGSDIVKIHTENDALEFSTSSHKEILSSTSFAAMVTILANLNDNDIAQEGIKYTREGMKFRVLNERSDRSKKETYKVKLADNIFGEHTLTNDVGKPYKVTIYDFKKKIGYINNIDWRSNKLCTTKHIMYLINYLEDAPKKTKNLKKKFPFIEIYTDPLNDYTITWLYPEKLYPEEEELLNKYFDSDQKILDNDLGRFYSFFTEAIDYERIKIRPEVIQKIEAYLELKNLTQLKEKQVLDYSLINASMYPYQQQGVEFCVFKKGAIIADEMGLGKTLQAIATAILKKGIFNFKKTLVICPASVQYQWKSEIEKFSNEKTIVIDGLPDQRAYLYLHDTSFFHIINYEKVLRDKKAINRANYDLVILDEAQKIKNYTTKTSSAIKSIQKNHGLVITGTPIENNLLELYSIVQFIDQSFLAPQWEFSYQHCIFDAQSKNRISGYYNLNNLKKRLNTLLIRREKNEVFSQLPNIVQKDIFVKLSPEQADLHSSFSRGIAAIMIKKIKTPFDWQKLMLLLTNMRMVCNSSYLIDKESHHSPKLIELRDILIEKLNIHNSNRKVIIFSEWVTMLTIIGNMLKKENIVYTLLTGKIPIKKRGSILKEFEENDDCKIFLSSETGGTGLNLQMADTVINFELPWNPAKKNQRIGRIDRIGQKNKKLQIFNLVSLDSIEMKIAAGLILKQSLFDGVLNSTNTTDEVSFSEKGRSQFLNQIKSIVDANEMHTPSDFEIPNEIPNDTRDIKKLLETDSPTITSKIPSSPDFEEQPIDDNKTTSPKKTVTAIDDPFEQMEETMTKGMDFLAGLFKMTTGNDLHSNGKPKINVNRETGEISFTFKFSDDLISKTPQEKQPMTV